MSYFVRTFVRITKNILRDFVEAHKFRKNSLYKHMVQKSFETSIEFANHNLINARRFNNRKDLIKFCINNSPKDGIYAEFGVYKGESIKIIAQSFKNKNIYGFDSFDGLPEDWGTVMPQGSFGLNRLPEVPNNVKLIKGLFKDTLPNFLSVNIENFSFIHVDCDLYQSTKDIFDIIETRITSGTVILFDELINVVDWQSHEYRAFQEFAERTGIKFKYIAYHSEQTIGAGTEVAVQII
ncbi:MAG: class I SAM-dependent methyltransferase [Alphaproteobacteria bacterium]|nr:class I SAM-dependent methyltransferase [Alphaproteobacteria bacterium]